MNILVNLRNLTNFAVVGDSTVVRTYKSGFNSLYNMVN